MTYELKISTLKAASLCAAKNDLRKVLNGVCIDIKNDSQMVIIGTDGACAFIGVEKYEGGWHGKSERIIIPLESIIAALKVCDKRQSYISLEKLSAEKWSLGAIIFNPIDGHYPDYARIIPKVENIQNGIGYYNTELLLKVNKAMKEASGNAYPTLNQHGEKDAAVMTCGMPNYICIIAPMNARNKGGLLDSYKGIELPQ